MKLFITIVLFAALASAEYKVRTREDLIRNREECAEQLKIPAEDLEKYKKWNFPDDAKTHCYLKCIFEKFELFNKDSGFNVENIHYQMVGGSHADHTDSTHGEIDKCAKDAKGVDDCARVYHAAMCFFAKNLQLVQMSVHAHEHDHSKH